MTLILLLLYCMLIFTAVCITLTKIIVQHDHDFVGFDLAKKLLILLKTIFLLVVKTLQMHI